MTEKDARVLLTFVIERSRAMQAKMNDLCRQYIEGKVDDLYFSTNLGEMRALVESLPVMIEPFLGLPK